MSRPADEVSRDALDLQAWHDGELGPLARWRFARRLARSEELQRELRALVSVGESVRASEPSAAAPDVWPALAGQLAAIDAQRLEGAWERRRAGRPGAVGLWKAASALAGAAAAVALAIALLSGENAPSGVVHWVDSGSRNVMVLDGERDVTVIWVLDPLKEGARRGGSGASA